MAIIDLSLPHCDVLYGPASAAMEKQGFKSSITQNHTMPKMECDVIFVDSCLSMFAHCDTHLDCTRHIDQTSRNLDQIPFEQFMGRPASSTSRPKGPGAAIMAMDLDLDRHLSLIREGDIALTYTGWLDKHWTLAHYLYHSPFLAGNGTR